MTDGLTDELIWGGLGNLRFLQVNSHRIYRAVTAPPYPQRLCRHSPWQHPPWTQIVAPWLPMSLLQAASARVCAHCDRSPCLGRQMAPIDKLRDGRSTGLGWLPLDEDTQQSTERWCR